MTLSPPPGYGPIIPLDRERHAGLGVRTDPQFASQLQAIYLTVDEFFEAAHHYPIAFTAMRQTGVYIPVAVLGLRENQNLFVDDAGAWREDVYRPAYVRRHPFCTAETGAGDASPVVCVEEGALDPTAPALFEAGGSETQRWTEHERLIGEFEAARERTQRYTERLKSLNLLEEFEAHVHGKDSAPQRLAGMMRITESKLQALDGATLETLMRDGDLARIYAHLFSLRKFADLMNLAGKR